MEYACFLDGVFHRKIDASAKPNPNPAKGFEWYPVGAPQTGTPEGWRVVGNEAVFFTAPYQPTRFDVNSERNRRIEAGVPFNGKVYDFDQMGKDNITGAATLAKFAILQGAQPGDLRWNGGDMDFTWIAQDNSKVPMDAQTVSALGDTAAGWTQKIIFAARALKDMSPIPADFKDDKYWT